MLAKERSRFKEEWIAGKRRSRVGMWIVVVAGAACVGDPIAPTLAACHSTVQARVLSVAVPIAIDPQASAGCVIFPANASSIDSAEYLLVPQAVAESPNFGRGL